MFNKVKNFHKTFGIYSSQVLNLPSQEIRNLRIALLKEEFEEYLLAEKNNDMIEIADALGDMLFIIFGTADSYGIPIVEIFNEIYNSNMSKLGADNKPIYRHDGKVLKGPNYFQPNIASILRKLSNV